MTCTVALSTSRTRTMLGSNRTAKVVIGDVLATCTKVAVAVEVRRPSVALRVTVRVTSVPGSGSGASNWASVWAVPPGGTCSSGPDQVTRTARSGSLALSCRCAHSLPPRLSATSRAQPVVRVTDAYQTGYDLQGDRWVLDLDRGRLLQRHRGLDVSGAVVRGDRELPGELGTGIRLGCGEREQHRRRRPGPDIDDRRIEVEPDRLFGVRAGEPKQHRPVAARVVDDHRAGGGVGVPHPEQAWFGAQLHRDVDDRHGDLDREILLRPGLGHRPDAQHQVDLLRRQQGGRAHAHPHRQRLLAAREQVDRVRLDDQPGWRPGGLDPVAVDDGGGVRHPYGERGRLARRRHGDGRMFGADLQPVLTAAGCRRLGHEGGRTQHGPHLVLGLLRVGGGPGRDDGCLRPFVVGVVALDLVPGQERMTRHAEVGPGRIALTAVAADVRRHRRPSSSRRDSRNRHLPRLAEVHLLGDMFSHVQPFRHPADLS